MIWTSVAINRILWRRHAPRNASRAALTTESVAGDAVMSKRITIRQVAEAAGVDRSSVSRAFTRPEMLNPATVTKVRQVAQDLGYVPNQAARALSTGRHGNIALVIPDVANPFFPPMVQAAQKAADGQGFCVFLGNSNEDPTQEARLITRFMAQVEGLIIASSRLGDEELRDYAARSPIVLVNREVDDLPHVLIDSGTGVTEAVQAMHALGHRSLAYVSGPANSWSNLRRHGAASAAAGRLGMAFSSLPAQIPGYEAGHRASADILASGATAVIVFDDLTAHGLMSGLRQRGITAPRDLSVIGCDDVLGNFTTPALSSISSPTAEAGALATQLLCERLAGKPTRNGYRLTTRFVARESSGPAR